MLRKALFKHSPILCHTLEESFTKNCFKNTTKNEIDPDLSLIHIWIQEEKESKALAKGNRKYNSKKQQPS